mgnify:CR=1 FL=1
MSKTKVMLPKPTAEEMIAELKRRIEFNRKAAAEGKKGRWKVQEYVCDRTAQELESIVSWYENT